MNYMQSVKCAENRGQWKFITVKLSQDTNDDDVDDENNKGSCEE